MKTPLIFLLLFSTTLIVEGSFLDRILFRKERNLQRDPNSGMFIWNDATDAITTENVSESPTTITPNVTRPPPRVRVASWNYGHVKPYLITTVFLMVVTICKLAFHKAERLSSIVPESCLLVVLGTIVGAFFYGLNIDQSKFQLTPDLFFLILLPPIILEAAFSLHDRVFFQNLGTILLYAVIGTLLSCFLMGLSLWGLAVGGAMGPISITLLQCLVFAALIVAVDPVAVLAIFQEIGVNDVLYFLVFGESLLNDAVTVVIYNTMVTLNQMDTIPPAQIVLGIVSFFTVSLGGLSIGIFIGAVSSFITKYTHDVRIVEPLAILIFAYGAYIFAELFHFSGIISIIGCGLMQAQYAFHNISMKSLTTISYFSKVISTTSDCIIFMFLGMALVRNTHVWHTGFILWTLLLCLVFRFIVVYSLTFFANFLRVRKIDFEEQFIMAYGGLRGAVAFSLVIMLDRHHIPQKELFITTTLVVVIATVFIQGITIKPLVKLFRIRKSGTKVLSMYQEINYQATDFLMTFMEELVGYRGQNRIREWLMDFDQKFLKRWFQSSPKTRENAIMALHHQMAMQLHYENLQQEVGSTEKLKHQSFFYDNEGDMDLYPLPMGLEKMKEVEEEIEENYARSIIEAKEEEEIKRRSLHEMMRLRSATMPQMSMRRRLLTNISLQRPSRTSQIGQLGQMENGQRRGSQMPQQEVNVDQLKKSFVKNIYRQKHDKNLLHDDQHDLVHILNEKRRRTLRMISMSLSPASSHEDLESLGSRGSAQPHPLLRRKTKEVQNVQPRTDSTKPKDNNQNVQKPVKSAMKGRGFLKVRQPSPRSPTAHQHPSQNPQGPYNLPLLATNIPISDQSDLDSDSANVAPHDVTTRPRPLIRKQDHLPSDVDESNV